MSNNTRGVDEVFAHHVQGLNEANMEDIGLDYGPDSFIITKDDGVVRGRDAIKKWFNAVLTGPLCGAKFDATTLIVEGGIVYLEWEGVGDQNRATGLDTFVIRDGEIKTQTIKLLSLTPK